MSVRLETALRGRRHRRPLAGHLVGCANPTELDCHDETEDPRTNESAINWDASLVYALASLYDPGAH
jgi:hypothetical protein